MQIALSLSHASTTGLIGVALIWLLRDAIMDDNAWWRLLVVLGACAVISLLLLPVSA